METQLTPEQIAKADECAALGFANTANVFGKSAAETEQLFSYALKKAAVQEKIAARREKLANAVLESLK